MKLTTVTHVSVDGVMQGLGGSDEDRRGGFERGGWALPLSTTPTPARTQRSTSSTRGLPRAV